MGWSKPKLDQNAPIVGNTLGARIVAALQRAGIGKTALAQRIDRGYQTVNNWTKNKTVPSAEDVRKIAEATGVNVEELLGIAAGQEPTFPAWLEFVKLDMVAALTVEERRTLAGIPWFGHEPTIESYLMALAAVKAAKRGPPIVTDADEEDGD
jgi:transcriptional regulator with XRE-family HTH domain